jgi:16S rRNA (adenine1518-N6/adenine1519-N6)-dimethyltransferase
MSADHGDGGYPHARKRFGQHFLRDNRILARIADALQLTGTETVVEIGPGRGALTDHLVRRAGRLIAIELDRDLASILRVRYATHPKVLIVEDDVLTVDFGKLAGDDFVLAGNVPYYITTPILFHALQPPRPRRAVYLVQKEVAERVVAPPGSKEYGALSVNVQGFANVEILFRVPPGAFVPVPSVDSAVIRVTPRAEVVIGPELEARFRTTVQAAFGLRRKQMRRVVRTIAALDADAADVVLAAAAIEPEVRPETLAPADFARLVTVLAAR